jgi:hypothetical protein
MKDYTKTKLRLVLILNPFNKNPPKAEGFTLVNKIEKITSIIDRKTKPKKRKFKKIWRKDIKF